MGGLFYTGQSRRTSGSFTVTCSGAEDIVKRLNKLENGGQTANQENSQRLYEPCACVGIEGNPRTLRGRHCRNQRGQTTTSEGAELNPSGGGSS